MLVLAVQEGLTACARFHLTCLSWFTIKEMEMLFADELLE